jgi:hypothetical protein
LQTFTDDPYITYPEKVFEASASSITVGGSLTATANGRLLLNGSKVRVIATLVALSRGLEVGEKVSVTGIVTADSSKTTVNIPLGALPTGKYDLSIESQQGANPYFAAPAEQTTEQTQTAVTTIKTRTPAAERSPTKLKIPQEAAAEATPESE